MVGRPPFGALIAPRTLHQNHSDGFLFPAIRLCKSQGTFAYSQVMCTYSSVSLYVSLNTCFSSLWICPLVSVTWVITFTYILYIKYLERLSQICILNNKKSSQQKQFLNFTVKMFDYSHCHHWRLKAGIRKQIFASFKPLQWRSHNKPLQTCNFKLFTALT